MSLTDISDNFSEQDLQKAHLALSSIASKCEKSSEKLKEGTPQYSLMRNRLKALHIALTLINKELMTDHEQ